MNVFFEGDRGGCRCYNCFYGFNVLKLEDFNIYRDEGIDISDGMKVTPSLIDRVFKVCHKTFRAHYYLEHLATWRPATDKRLVLSRVTLYHRIRPPNEFEVVG